MAESRAVDEFSNEDEFVTTDSEREAGEEPQTKKSKKVYKQKYNRQWEKDPELKPWIAPCKSNPYSAECRVCNKTLTAGLSELKRHAKTKKHLDMTKTRKTTRCITDIMGPVDTLKEDIKVSELKLAMFVAEHNISFQAMDHLTEVLRSAFPDSKIATQFACKHTKVRSLIKNVLAKHLRADLVAKLKLNRFSIIIDETTDVATQKQLAIVVRFFCEEQNTVKSQFFKVIEVAAADATTIVTTINSLFQKEGIPIDNIVGYASDTTNVMFGQNHSVVTLLKQRLPNLVVIKCLCHTAHLCASHACEKLPRSIESFIRDVYSHFSHSAKRIAQYKTFQHFTETEPHKILRPAQTRWLSLEGCVRRVLEQWPALEAYFESAAENDRLVSSQNILSALKNPIYKLYLFFLKFVLPKFTNFNKLFQSEKPNLHILDKCLETTYKAFLSCYMSTAYLSSRSIELIDPASTIHMLPLSSMTMGQDVTDFLMKPELATMKREVLGFLEHVRSFYIEAANQIKSRFPINDPVIKSLRFLMEEINTVSK